MYGVFVFVVGVRDRQGGLPRANLAKPSEFMGLSEVRSSVARPIDGASSSRKPIIIIIVLLRKENKHHDDNAIAARPRFFDGHPASLQPRALVSLAKHLVPKMAT